MAENKKEQKTPTTFERGANIPTQNKVPQMPTVKPPVQNSSSGTKDKK